MVGELGRPQPHHDFGGVPFAHLTHHPPASKIFPDQLLDNFTPWKAFISAHVCSIVAEFWSSTVSSSLGLLYARSRLEANSVELKTATSADFNDMSIDFPKEEEVVLEKWRELNAFHRQVSDNIYLCEHRLKIR